MSGIAVGNLAAITTLWAGGLTLGHGWPRIGAAGERRPGAVAQRAWEKIHT